MLNRKWIAGAVCVAAMAVSTMARAEARVYFEAPSEGATVSNPVHVKFEPKEWSFDRPATTRRTLAIITC